MKKLFQWCKANPLSWFALLLLVFIPLYPKLPLLDVRHTWVYVRLEDFLVLLVLFFWGLLLVRKKISLTTPLTLPILAFWIIGAAATFHGILIIFPSLADVYPNVAFLSYLRRIEYMGLFFVGYAAVKDKRLLGYLLVVLTGTLVVVALYGIGQKYFALPAILTMNEEFAKGIPIKLSALSRVSSTFSGHYDLAAYLVLVLPILMSVAFAFRRWVIRSALLLSVLVGCVVLFMTVSRISLVALVLALGFVLLVQRWKLVIVSLPVMAIATLLLVSFLPALTNRLGSTIKEIAVLVDAKTGAAIGHPKEVPNTYFTEKVVYQYFSQSTTSLAPPASPSAGLVLPYTHLGEKVVLLVDPDAPTGEDLPQGTGYINLLLSPVTKKLGSFLYEPKPKVATAAPEVFVINGNFLLKKVLTYDLSFTTRFQGEWPRAITAFKRNILVGSGYGSVGLAVDNSYLRMLAETGILGLVSYLAIFMFMGIYLRRILPRVDSQVAKSFFIGFIAGIIGLAVNALFIDVFEASKVAFLLWLLTGITLGTLRLYQRLPVDFFREIARVITSTPAIVVYLLIATLLFYSSITRNYFVGDDFTWFRWVADCGNEVEAAQRCPLSLSTLLGYFTQADGFFYRPGAKLYFLLMYNLFWLNQTVYHVVSLLLHFVVAVLVFFLAKKILKRLLLSSLAAFLFLMVSGYSEAVHWISATGFLFTASFSLASLLGYISWEEEKKRIYFVATLLFFVLSLLFHELGIVTPLFYLLYTATLGGSRQLRVFVSDLRYKLLFLPIPFYLLIRTLAHSHWFSGDYSYNLVRLPFNAVGNAVGYLLLTAIGPFFLALYHAVRNGLREHLLLALAVSVLTGLVTVWVSQRILPRIAKDDRRVYRFGLFFFIISLLPFLGLGNIASRYSYLATIGVIFCLTALLHKLYTLLLGNGRMIAVAASTLAVGIFSLFHIIQQQQMHRDWYQAGEQAKQFLLAMEGVYEDEWARDPIELHLVNVPIRSGEAWVFPVGISDALWLLFHNPRLTVSLWPTVGMAISRVSYDETNQKVFEFDGSGAVIERKKIPPTP